MSIRIGRILATSAVSALAIANFAVQYGYVSRSAGGKPQYGVMLNRLARLHDVAPEGPAMIDVPEIGKDNVVALYARGRPAVAYGADGYVGPIGRNTVERLSRVDFEAARLAIEVTNSYHRYQFDLSPDASARHEFLRFAFAGRSGSGRGALVTMAGDQSILNSSADHPATGRYYVRALDDVSNYLVLIGSTLGHRVIPGVIDGVALWQREPDFSKAATGMQAMGRHLLFEVLNPAPGSRMLLDVTTGPLGRLDVELSHAAVFGEGRKEFALIGRGAARVLSDPIAPRTIDGRYYVALDMGVDPQMVPYERHGLGAQYNRQLNLDPRRIVGFARNISLVTEEQARAMSPPTAIAHFPADLFAAGLLFSGVYEDGWMAEAAKFRLGSDHQTSSVRITAHLPGAFARLSGAMFEVLVDGQSVARRRLAPGDFELQAAIPRATGPRWVELRVDATDRLPSPDQRIASILLKSVALEGGERPN
jgi:hypothetical protein